MIKRSTPEWVEKDTASELLDSDGDLAYKPFPIEVFSKTTRQYIVDTASVIGFDRAFVAVPMLAALASAVGDAFELKLNSTWSVPSVIWIAIVAKSGVCKSAGVDAVRNLLSPIEADYNRQFIDAEKAYRRQLTRHKIDLAEWKKSRESNDLPPEEPQAPVRKCLLVDDTTTEAMPGILNENPYGLLVAPDELAGFFAGFDAYKSSKGKDVPFWLSSYDAREARVDRKGSGRTFVAKPLVSIMGTIQPAILKNALIGNRSGDGEHIENGLAARFMLANPPAKPKRWSTTDVPQKTRTDMEGLVNRLIWMRYNNNVASSDIENEFDDFANYGGDPFNEPSEVVCIQGPSNQDDRPERIRLHLTTEAVDVWAKFVNDHGQETFAMKGPLQFVWPKLEGVAARVALVLHVVAEIDKGKKRDEIGPIMPETIQAGIKVAKWFGNEAKRIYADLYGTTAKKRDKLIQWIRSKGGEVSVRDLTRGPRKYSQGNLAEATLEKLASDGLGVWKTCLSDKAEGGRPKRVFVLADTADC